MENRLVKYDINNYEQNHPELIVEDLANYVSPEVIRFVLKYRGVNKWFRVRRLLIQLKALWLIQIKELQEKKKNYPKNSKEYYKLVGYVEALTDCRQQIRALCHSPRDIDFPLDKHDFGSKCKLPDDFPSRPHKRYLVEK